MTLQSVLFHLSDADTAAELLTSTLRNGAVCKAHITGVVVLPPPIVIPAGMPGHPDVIVLDGRRREMQQAAERIRPNFDAALVDGACSGAFSVVDADAGSVTQTLIDLARSADLVVLRQSGLSWSSLDDVEAPDSIVLDCGRPVLIMPRLHRTPTLGRRALVAWNGSRESARAVFDAIPLLMGADAVKILWACPNDAPYMASGMTIERLREALQRHGINCNVDCARVPRDQTGPALLAAAAAFEADLIVMGCYGRSRLNEFVLGGATRHVLENMQVPVLMSH